MLWNSLGVHFWLPTYHRYGTCKHTHTHKRTHTLEHQQTAGTERMIWCLGKGINSRENTSTEHCCAKWVVLFVRQNAKWSISEKMQSKNHYFGEEYSHDFLVIINPGNRFIYWCFKVVWAHLARVLIRLPLTKRHTFISVLARLILHASCAVRLCMRNVFVCQWGNRDRRVEYCSGQQGG